MTSVSNALLKCEQVRAFDVVLNYIFQCNRIFCRGDLIPIEENLLQTQFESEKIQEIQCPLGKLRIPRLQIKRIQRNHNVIVHNTLFKDYHL